MEARRLIPFSPYPLASACRALVDELEWEIAQVDPKKTIQMGSFRPGASSRKTRKFHIQIDKWPVTP